MRKYKGILVLVAAAGAVAVLLDAPGLAQDAFMKRIRKDHSLNPRVNGNCKLCHAPKENEKPNRENLNAFGKQIQAQEAMKPLLGKDHDYKFSKEELDTLMTVVDGLAGQDADGDGATNGEEIALGTFPGDEKSKPDEKALAKHRDEQKAKEEKK